MLQARAHRDALLGKAKHSTARRTAMARDKAFVRHTVESPSGGSGDEDGGANEELAVSDVL